MTTNESNTEWPEPEFDQVDKARHESIEFLLGKFENHRYSTYRNALFEMWYGGDDFCTITHIASKASVECVWETYGWTVYRTQHEPKAIDDIVKFANVYKLHLDAHGCLSVPDTNGVHRGLSEIEAILYMEAWELYGCETIQMSEYCTLVCCKAQ